MILSRQLKLMTLRSNYPPMIPLDKELNQGENAVNEKNRTEKIRGQSAKINVSCIGARVIRSCTKFQIVLASYLFTTVFSINALCVFRKNG